MFLQVSKSPEIIDIKNPDNWREISHEIGHRCG